MSILLLSIETEPLQRYFLADPTSEEEELLNGTFTIVLTNTGKLCSIYKPGGTPISEQKLKDYIETVRDRIQEVSKLIESSSGS
jgi:exosome complex component RRP45